MTLRPLRLDPSFREKVWGTSRLEPWFPDAGEKIGEAWFSFDDTTTSVGVTLGELMERHGAALLGHAVPPSPGGGPGGRFPILVKFIFTSEKLSVQVHPSDEYALPREGSPGKTEMWHILRADPGARIALGFHQTVERGRLRDACRTGEVERMLNWIDAVPGDTYFTPSGTVHAIGAGLALCEIQQNSDLTYRLYDYGRPRELHLDQSLEVCDFGPHPGRATPNGALLAQCRYFATELFDVEAPCDYAPDPERFHLLIALSGSGRLDGRSVRLGEVWLVPASAEPFRIEPNGALQFLKTYVPRA